MPTYAYQCTACAHTFDIFQQITDGALTECPKCGKASLQRAVGGGEVTFRFEGEGFYVNDSKKEHGCGCGKHTCCRTKNDKN